MISYKGVSREPSSLKLTFIYSNKRNRHVTEGSHRTTRSGGQDKSVARIDWALMTKVETVNTANSANINTKVDHHLSSEVSEKEVKQTIRYLRGKQVFFSQKWVVLLPFSPKEFFLLLQSPSIKCLSSASFKHVNLIYKPAALHDMVLLGDFCLVYRSFSLVCRTGKK